MPREPAWHRNLRRTRQNARGILTAAELGIVIPQEIVTAAKGALIDHHATDADTMLSWSAQQKKTPLSNLMDMMNNFVMQNQTGQTPWGNGGKTGWKGNGMGMNQGGNKGGYKGGGKGGKDGGKGGQALNQNMPKALCNGCGGMHFRSQCPAKLNQTICQQCYRPGHLEPLQKHAD